ncbi:MAG: DJ-1/PfpI family protein [Clostridiales bacterium]|nr:DJ-1/PfpI family protein [Clostridiales bacterium]MBR6483957.1 DJ-1/PfpI family protein [Clostridiales bacterium]
MSKITIFITDGTEETECLTTVDLMRRAGVDTELVSAGSERKIISSHKVTIEADKTIDEADYEDSDMIFIPGGMPGVTNFLENEKLIDLVKDFYNRGKFVSAVCAGPSVLGKAGILEGKRATCFPGWEDKLTGATYTAEGVTTDGKIITGRGLGFSIELGLELIKVLEGEEKAADIRRRIQHPDTI